MQIQSVHLTAVSLAKTKTQTIGAVEDVGRVGLINCWWQCELVQTALYTAATLTEQEPQPACIFINR